MISTDMEIRSEMKKDTEKKTKVFLGHTDKNEAKLSRQKKVF